MREGWILLAQGAAGEVEEERLEGGTLRGEEAAGEGVGLREAVESRELIRGMRAETVGVVFDGEVAVRGERRGEGGGRGRGGEADFLLEGQAQEEFVERAEGVELAVVDDADARAEPRGLLHVV